MAHQAIEHYTSIRDRFVEAEIDEAEDEDDSDEDKEDELEDKEQDII